MIGVGVVGYGYWGPNLARVAAECEGMRVEVVADRSDQALARALQRHPVARMVTDWRDLVADPKVDVVMIATPVSTHFDVAMAALKAGKHVLVEKPMAESAAKAALLVQEAERRNLVLMVDHTFVFTGAVQKIRSLIDEGEIGDVYYYDSTRVNLGLFQRDVNVIWDLAVHDFAIMDFLLDAVPVAISASAAGFVPNSPENLAHLSVFFDNGSMAHLNVNWLSPVKLRQTLIGGSRRMVIYDDMQTSEKVKVYDRGAVAVEGSYEQMISYRLGDMWAPALSSREALQTEMRELKQCLETGAKPVTDGSSGLRVVELLEAASRSSKMRGQPIELGRMKKAS
jgi:predicted dehydrogenase